MSKILPFNLSALPGSEPEGEMATFLSEMLAQESKKKVKSSKLQTQKSKANNVDHLSKIFDQYLPTVDKGKQIDVSEESTNLVTEKISTLNIHPNLQDESAKLSLYQYLQGVPITCTSALQQKGFIKIRLNEEMAMLFGLLTDLDIKQTGIKFLPENLIHELLRNFFQTYREDLIKVMECQQLKQVEQLDRIKKLITK